MGDVPAPEVAEQAAVEGMSPGTYMPLWQLMAMGIEDEIVVVNPKAMLPKLATAHGESQWRPPKGYEKQPRLPYFGGYVPFVLPTACVGRRATS